ncbi:hypothetical protein K2X33_13840 [bacterium]|nr:hypothetical protein [bacterium]
MKSLFLATVALAFSNTVLAETSPSTTGTTTTTAPAPASAVTGVLEFRPTLSPDDNKVTTQNEATIRYQVNPNWRIGYTQYFGTNFGFPGQQGVGLVGMGSFISSKLPNVWKNVAGDLSLSMDTQLRLPTAPSQLDAGMVASARHYTSLTKKVNDTVTLNATHITVLHGFNNAGKYSLNATTGAMEAKANALLDQRLYLTVSLALSEDLSLDLPLMMWATLNRPMGGGDPFSFWLTIWPELTYKVADATTVGLSFQGDNLLKGFKGYPQAVFHQDL